MILTVFMSKIPMQEEAMRPSSNTARPSMSKISKRTRYCCTKKFCPDSSQETKIIFPRPSMRYFYYTKKIITTTILQSSHCLKIATAWTNFFRSRCWRIGMPFKCLQDVQASINFLANVKQI